MQGNAIQATPQPAPVLGQLKFAAERVGSASERVQWFVNRFHGDATVAGNANAGSPDVKQDTYRNDIDSLFRQIDKLETIIGQLDAIG